MPVVLIVVLIVAGAIGAWFLVSFAAAHLAIVLVSVFALTASAVAVFTAVSRGMDKRNARRWVPPAVNPPKRRPQLPPVAASYSWEQPPPPAPPGNFSSGETYEREEPVVLVSAEPAAMCEGPGCGQVLPEDPWQCGPEGGPADEGNAHSFCCRTCTETWISARQATIIHH